MNIQASTKMASLDSLCGPNPEDIQFIWNSVKTRIFPHISELELEATGSDKEEKVVLNQEYMF